MNYLAHAYLSFDNPNWITGNLVSDFVKGKKKYDFPLGIQQGIALHRAIDAFTDSHEITRKAKEIFRKDYRLYAGAFLDVSYDHFLANDLDHFKNKEELANFTLFAYQSLKSQYPQIPVELHPMFNRMMEQNWLYNYQFNWGIEKSFAGVVYRSKYLQESVTAFRLFEENYVQLKEYYNHFFSTLFDYAKGLVDSDFSTLQL